MDSRRIRESGKKYKTVLMHRYVWENHNNARLLKHAVVHHIDGDIHNNDPSNLEAMMREQHKKTFTIIEPIPIGRKCSRCGTDKTYVNKKGHANWYKDDEEILCQQCYHAFKM